MGALPTNGAATRVALRQTATYHGTGRVTVTDPWFSTDEMLSLLYSNILVKAAQKGLPRELLNKTNLSR